MGWPAMIVSTLRLPTLQMAPRSTSSEIDALQARILACRACQAAGYVEEARPVRHPWTPRQRLMLVGQAPGALTHARQFHFAGPGGRVLEQWFEQAGFTPGTWRERTYLTSLTRCFPGKSSHGKGDRKPSPRELAQCRPFLDAELTLVRPRLIVLVGTMAIEHFLGKRPLESVVGRLIEHPERRYLPLPHPSPVSRWLNQANHQHLVSRAIALLAQCRAELEL